MEHLVRILNDGDRQKLAWLRTHVGDARLTDAAHQLVAQREQSPGVSAKPYISAVCRYLGVWPPSPHRPERIGIDGAIADRHLAQIRQLLAQRIPRARRAA
jgi:hypothetical protein